MVSYLEEVINLEWEMFDNVKNVGGRASCQDNFETFSIMRGSQFESWDEVTLESYHNDLLQAEKRGRNLLTEKYGYMMQSSSPKEYDKIKQFLPSVSPEKERLIEMIIGIEMEWTINTSQIYPLMSKQGRPIHTSEDSVNSVSVETYMRGELKTYSENTLKYLLCYILNLKERGENISLMILENMVKKYGYTSIEHAEQTMRKKFMA